jgi:hypothetical protein
MSILHLCGFYVLLVDIYGELECLRKRDNLQRIAQSPHDIAQFCLRPAPQYLFSHAFTIALSQG